MNLKDIDSLAISGAGVRIVAEVGAMCVLEKKGVLNQIKHVGGTSAGAIIAALHAIGYATDELSRLCLDLDFNKFEDGNISEKLNVLNDYGINKGKYFLDFIEQKIEAKTGSRYTTFAGLKAKGMKDLSVFATNLNTQSIKVFNYKQTPNVAIAHAVRCSMSIPLFFEIFEIPNDKNIYVDGGCNFNYPLNFYNENTSIGITFDSYKEVPDNGLKRGQFKKYMTSLLATIANSQSVNLEEDESDIKRSIVIPTLGISAIDFDLTPKNKEDMLNAGMIAASLFIYNFNK